MSRDTKDQRSAVTEQKEEAIMKKNDIEALRAKKDAAEKTYKAAERALDNTPLGDPQLPAAQAKRRDAGEALGAATKRLTEAEQQEMLRKQEEADRRARAEAERTRREKVARRDALDAQLRKTNDLMMKDVRHEASAIADVIAELGERPQRIKEQLAGLQRRHELVRSLAADRGELAPTVEPIGQGTLAAMVGGELLRRGVDTRPLRPLLSVPEDERGFVHAALAAAGHSVREVRHERYYTPKIQADTVHSEGIEVFLDRREQLAQMDDPDCARAAVRKWCPDLAADHEARVIERMDRELASAIERGRPEFTKRKDHAERLQSMRTKLRGAVASFKSAFGRSISVTSLDAVDVPDPSKKKQSRAKDAVAPA